ncbi:ATP-binding protein [Streptomyces sp. NPDC126514]|uniref:sensor histidine kinase n=1 Tax=Streptomyces sp. NPDC126514 TaxID=3155210 RepID=UPI00331A6130
MVDQGAAEADLAGIAVHDECAEAAVLGDALPLERLVHNLVANGVRHNTGHGGWVRMVSRAADEGRVALEVSNTGPPVPPYEVPRLFEPFRRLGADRVVTGRARASVCPSCGPSRTPITGRCPRCPGRAGV